MWVTHTPKLPGRVAQSVTCLATDACLTADPGVVSSIPARSHTFVEIDHEIISTVNLLPSADSFKKGCCQLQAKVCAQITGKPLVQACPGKSVVKWTDRPAMTIAVDLGRKATKTNKHTKTGWISGKKNLTPNPPRYPKVPPLGMTQAAEWKFRLICYISFICEEIHKVWFKNLWNWLCNSDLMIFDLLAPP